MEQLKSRTCRNEHMKDHYIIQFARLSMKDLAKVGGKNASPGEMMQHLTPMGIENIAAAEKIIAVQEVK